MGVRYVVVVSDPDPVARAVAAHWGTPPSTGEFVDGAPLRSLAPDVLMVRRPTLHIHDERLDTRLPDGLQAARAALVFPSVHRSEGGRPALTVHPLGNAGASAEVGGRPRTVSPTAPRLMADALRRVADVGGEVAVPVSYESTHHGPELGLPSFFVEVGVNPDNPPSEIVGRYAEILRELTEQPSDRVAIAAGGGHYAPHFTELALKRQWAFGHLLSRHSLEELDLATAASVREASPEADGVLVARAQDYEAPSVHALGRRLKEGEAPARGPTRDRPGD